MDSKKKQQSIVLLQINKASAHNFLNGQKAQISSGNCKFTKLVKEHSQTIYFLVVGQFYYKLTKPIVFAKIQYPLTVSYLFLYWQSGICAISFHNNTEEIAKIDEILKNTVTLMTFNSAIQDPKFSQSIMLNCPNVQQHEIDPPSKLKTAIQKASQYIGTSFWTATHYLADQTEKTEKQIVKKYEDAKRQLEKKQKQTKQQLEKRKKALEQTTDKNWNKIKQETGQFKNVSEQYLRNIWNPIIQIKNQFVNQVYEDKKTDQNHNSYKIKQIARTPGIYAGQTTQGSNKVNQQLTAKTAIQSKQNQKKGVI